MIIVRLKRLICRLLGHTWYWKDLGRLGVVWGVRCHRCDLHGNGLRLDLR